MDNESEDYALEDRVLGFTHAQIGAFLAIQWKLPKRLADSISFHHQPMASEDELPIAHLIHLGDYVAKQTFYDRQDAYMIGSLQDGVADYLNVTESDLEEFGSLLREEYVKAETFIQMAGLST